jgi:DNA-binding IclR family transcriptional regulator
VYLATVQSNGPIAMTHRPGAQIYLHSTAMGKAMLAEMSDEEVRTLLGRTPLPKLTAKTGISLNQLIADCTRYVASARPSMTRKLRKLLLRRRCRSRHE